MSQPPAEEAPREGERVYANCCLSWQAIVLRWPIVFGASLHRQADASGQPWRNTLLGSFTSHVSSFRGRGVLELFVVRSEYRKWKDEQDNQKRIIKELRVALERIYSVKETNMIRLIPCTIHLCEKRRVGAAIVMCWRGLALACVGLAQVFGVTTTYFSVVSETLRTGVCQHATARVILSGYRLLFLIWVFAICVCLHRIPRRISFISKERGGATLS